MTKRAILYARVSGDDRKYATSGIDSQLADCRRYATERGYQIVGDVYETPDKMTSGADWLPELDRMLKLAQSGGFDVLIVREVDRLARNRFKQMSVEIQLESCGVHVEYVIGQFEESAEGRLLKGLMSEFAEYEREKIRQRTVRGALRSVESGNIKAGGFGAPYGYSLATVDGKRSLAIDEKEAAIVRLIFDLYVNQRLGFQTIGQYLAERQVEPPRRSGAWRIATIGHVLGNETYTGRWHYGKHKRRKGGKKVAQPREEWIEVRVPAIIDDYMFDAAEEIRSKHKRLRGKQHKHFYLLGGMLRCGECGYSITGHTVKQSNGAILRYYRCSVAQSHKRYARFNMRCDARNFRTERVDPIVWEYVKAIYMQPETLRAALDNYRAKQSEVKCAFRRKRSPIPGHGDHSNRLMAITPKRDDTGNKIIPLPVVLWQEVNELSS